jgi:hypothetical protein
MKRLAICMFALSLLPLSGAVALAQGNAGGKVKEVKVKKEKDKEKSVPEPSLLLLLGGAAGVVGARKMWQNRG